MDFGHVHAHAHRLRHLEDAVGRRRADRSAQHIPVVALAEALDLDLVQTVQAGLQRTQRLLQGFAERAPDRHGFADRLHRGREHRLRAREFLEGEARNLGDDIVDRRLEGRRGQAPGDVVGDLVQRVADGELGRDLGDRETGRLRRQRRGARHARIHLDHDHPPVGRVDRKLHVRAARLDADLAQNRDRGVAHHLEFLVGEGQRRRDGDGIAGMDAHRVDVLDRADDDAIVRLVADDLHLEFLPAEHALLDQHFAGRGGVDPALDDLDELALVVGDAAAGAAHREARPDDRRKTDILKRVKRLRKSFDVMGSRRLKADFGHGLAEELAILGLVDRFRRRADHLDVVLFQHAHFFQAERAIERSLAAHRRQKREPAGNGVALLLDDLGDDFRGDRLDIGPVRHLRIGHDRGRIRIDEDDAIAFLAQRLAGLRPRIIELAGLTDDDRARADDKDGRDIGALRHKSSGRDAPALGLPQTAFTRRKAPSRPIIDRKARVLGKILKRRRAGSADPGAALGRSLAENRSARKGLRGLHNRRTIAPQDSPGAGRGSCSRRWRNGEDQLILDRVSRGRGTFGSLAGPTAPAYTAEVLSYWATASYSPTPRRLWR